jgi:predicted ATPase
VKILRLDIKGFRSLKDVSWEPGDLNVVIGPNGSGKSNLLRMLELISVSARGGLGKYVQRWGGMEPLVWDGRAEEIAYTLQCVSSEANQDTKQETLTYELVMERLGRGASFRVTHEWLTAHRDQPDGSVRLVERERGHNAVILEADNHNIVIGGESLIDFEEATLLSLWGSPPAGDRRLQQFGSDLAGWSVYHDVHMDASAPVRQAVVTRTEKRVEPDGQNLISVLHTLYTGDRDFKNEVNLAMRAAFGEDFDELVFPPAADQRIQLRVRWKSLQREQSAADLSDGTLRFLFLLAVLASPSPSPLIAIDEPETGLHPSMLPIVAEYAVDASSRTQVIFTTHSPQFLDAFRETRPTTTVAKWSNGETLLEELEGESLDHWLKEYSLGSLFQAGDLEGMA